MRDVISSKMKSSLKEMVWNKIFFPQKIMNHPNGQGLTAANSCLDT